jgi:CBS-domain-containing membrane protein
MPRSQIKLSPEFTLPRAYMLMKAQGQSFLPVADSGQLVGVLRWQDIQDRIEKYQSRPEAGGLSVQMSMLSPIAVVGPTVTLGQLTETMATTGAEAAIVADSAEIKGDTRILGLITQSALIMALAKILSSESMARPDTVRQELSASAISISMPWGVRSGSNLTE